MDFVDFKWISWISNGFRGFQMDFVDFKWISGFPVDFSRFLDFRLDFCDVVRDFARVGPLGCYSLIILRNEARLCIETRKWMLYAVQPFSAIVSMVQCLRGRNPQRRPLRRQM